MISSIFPPNDLFLFVATVEAYNGGLQIVALREQDSISRRNKTGTIFKTYHTKETF